MPDQERTAEPPPDYREFGEPLSKYIRRIEEVEERADLTAGLITSRDLHIPPLTSGPVRKIPIVWRLYEYSMFYIIRTEAKTLVERHSHNEDVFRLVMEGSLRVSTGEREIEFKSGDWFVIRSGQNYEISTEDGYTVMCTYRIACLRPESGP